MPDSVSADSAAACFASRAPNGDDGERSRSKKPRLRDASMFHATNASPVRDTAAPALTETVTAAGGRGAGPGAGPGRGRSPEVHCGLGREVSGALVDRSVHVLAALSYL